MVNCLTYPRLLRRYILPPVGCNVFAMQGEFLAPAAGFVTRYTFPEPDFGPDGQDYGYHLTLPSHTYVAGIQSALVFAGVQDPDISKVTDIVLDFGHIQVVEGQVAKGQSIGDVRGSPGFPPEDKFAWQVGFYYNTVGYMFTPTLFTIDGPAWSCAATSSERCIPRPLNYAP